HRIWINTERTKALHVHVFSPADLRYRFANMLSPHTTVTSNIHSMCIWKCNARIGCRWVHDDRHRGRHAPPTPGTSGNGRRTLRKKHNATIANGKASAVVDKPDRIQTLHCRSPKAWPACSSVLGFINCTTLAT